jgi:hypothetical protein
MDEILKIQACTSDKLSALRYVNDKISVHVRGLASLGISSEQYGSLLMPIIMSKMPSDELLQTIKIEIEVREASEATKATENSSHKFPKSQGSAKGYIPPSNQNKGRWYSFKIQCVYCEGSHYSASCDQVISSEALRKF